MSKQAAKFIDITRSFIPLDPATFPETLHATGKEDYPEDAAKVVAYKGKNFLPTAYGYKSYFGTNSALGIDALTSKLDKILILQTNIFSNILVAMCEDGIWTKQGEEAGAWTHEIILEAPIEGEHLDWSYCVIGTELYMYRAGLPHYYRLSAKASNADVEQVAAGINNLTLQNYDMAGGLAAGTYKYQVAWFDANNALSAPSTATELVVGVPSSIRLTFTKPAGATKYRVYRTFNSVTKYFDSNLPSGATSNLYDANEAGIEVSFPDTTWVTDVTNLEFKIQTVVPSFLNMEGQLGIFKAGMRLGFWDSANSTAWSSIDDLANFTPSIETLAGSAIFGDIVGRIVNILPHGEGFIIYATKSIIYIKRMVEATFQWDAEQVLGSAGISFPEEACVSNPDTVHFAWTTAGVYKIEEGRPEVIIPEVYDYLKTCADPINLQVLAGRYLFLQLMDEAYLDGTAQFSVSNVPSTTITFPSDITVEDLPDPLTLTGNEVCYTMAGMEAANSGDGSGAGAAASAAGAPDKQPNTMYTPLYTVHLSYGNAIDPERITWGPTPCATVGPDGVEYNLSPIGNYGKITRLTQDSTNKAIYTDDPASPATRWTIEKFVATQLAIWGIEDEVRAAFLQAIVNRAATATGNIVTANNPGPSTNQYGLDYYTCPAPSSAVPDYCNLGDYIVAMSAPHMGMNSCSFWLTRYATKKVKIKRKKTVTQECTITYGAPYWHDVANAVPGPYADPLATVAARQALVYPGFPTYWYVPIDDKHGHGWFARSLPEGDFMGCFPRKFWPSTKVTKDVMNAHNVMDPIEEGIFGVETAWIELTGWAYTDINGNQQVISRGASCVRSPAPDTPPTTPSMGDSGSSTGNVPVDNNGTLCGIPFQPITLPAISVDPIVWPTQEVVIPGSTFLLQKGSIGPIYPAYVGAYVYDLHLKKWGKLVRRYLRLLDYSPINSNSGGIIPISTFGMNSGLMAESGKIYLFDSEPAESSISYGKIGLHRLGFTNLEEVRANFAQPFNGFLAVESSLDGKNLEPSLYKSIQVVDANVAEMGVSLAARWYNITISGKFDLTHVEFRGLPSSRR